MNKTPSKSEICARLIRDAERLPPRLQVAAKYIVDHGNDFAFDTIRETATRIGISPNSLVRLAQHLGFENFDQLRQPFRQALLEQSDANSAAEWIDRLSEQGGTGAAHAKALRNEASIVMQSLRHFSPQKAQRAIELLQDARHVHVTATRSSFSLAHYFHYVGRMAMPNLHLTPGHMGSPVDDLLELDERDVLLAITFPPYSAEAVDALKQARALGTRIILLSDSEQFIPGLEVDLFLKVSVRSQHHFHCFAGAMAILDCLLNHLILAGGEAAQERINRYQQVRETFGAYWQPRLPRVRR